MLELLGNFLAAVACTGLVMLAIHGLIELVAWCQRIEKKLDYLGRRTLVDWDADTEKLDALLPPDGKDGGA